MPDPPQRAAACKQGAKTQVYWQRGARIDKEWRQVDASHRELTQHRYDLQNVVKSNPRGFQAALQYQAARPSIVALRLWRRSLSVTIATRTLQHGGHAEPPFWVLQPGGSCALPECGCFITERREGGRCSSLFFSCCLPRNFYGSSFPFPAARDESKYQKK